MDIFLGVCFVLLLIFLPYVSFYITERLRAKAWSKEFDKRSKKML